MQSCAPATEETFSFANPIPQPSDARGEQRYTSLLRVGVLQTRGGQELCLIRNISARGLKAQVFTDLAVGDRVRIELKTAEEVSGSVVWVRGNDMGLVFDAPIDIEHMLASHMLATKGLQPRMPRIEVRCPVRLRLGARFFRCMSLDVSQGGLKIESEDAFPLRDVVVTMAGFRPIPGQVRWSSAPFSGISFNQPLPFREMVGWLKSVQADAGDARR